MTKTYKEFKESVSPYVIGSTMSPGVRRDLNLFLKSVSSTNHDEKFIDRIGQRFAAHGYSLQMDELNGMSLDDGGEFELEIMEVGSRKIVDDGKTTLLLNWERLGSALNPEDANMATAKEYRVKAALMTELESEDDDTDM